MDAEQDAEEFAEPTFDRCINVVTQQAPICLVMSSNAEWSHHNGIILLVSQILFRGCRAGCRGICQAHV